MTKEKEYMEFVEAVAGKIAKKLKLPAEGVRFEQGKGENCRDRLLIEVIYENGLKGIFGIEAAALFLLYKRGASLDDLAEQIQKDQEKKCTKETIGILQDIEDYEKLKEHLIIRAVNYTGIQEAREDCVYKRFGDIALVVYLALRETEYDFLSAKVQKKALEKWGKGEEEVFEHAMINTHVLYPPRIYDWLRGDGRFTYQEGVFMNPMEDFVMEKGPRGNCLTNVKQLNGATALFYPGVAKRIAGLLGEDFYAVFTSIHEVMIHGISSIDLEIIEASLENINENNEKEEILSNRVYYYNQEENTLTLAEK